ncbi:MAG: 3-hydroxyacyl-CoA dehydrogenase, partial [Acidobacteria bacterium]
MSESVSLTKDGEIAVITIDNPPVNALSAKVAEGIRAALEAAQNDLSVKAIVLIGAGRTFIAGADIKEFGKITSGEKGGPELNLLLQNIEDCAKPV